MLKNLYEVRKGYKIYHIAVVSSDLAEGRYQIVSFELDNIHHNRYETVAEAEQKLEAMKKIGMFDEYRKLDGYMITEA